MRQPLEQMSQSPEPESVAAEPSEPSSVTPETSPAAGLVVDRGLRRTLYLVGGGIIFVIGVLAGVLILTSAAKLFDQQADAAVKDYAGRTSRLVEQSVLERRREVELLATMPWLVEFAATGKAAKGIDVDDQLARFRSRSQFRHLTLYDRTGRILAVGIAALLTLIVALLVAALLWAFRRVGFPPRFAAGILLVLVVLFAVASEARAESRKAVRWKAAQAPQRGHWRRSRFAGR